MEQAFRNSMVDVGGAPAGGGGGRKGRGQRQSSLADWASMSTTTGGRAPGGRGGGPGRVGDGGTAFGGTRAAAARRGVASAAGTFSLDPVMSYLSMKIFTILLCLNCQKVTN